ncbi:hypothetical protein BC826DRAFT_143458 [Russula brevipes]|nr:hypothetical protein BC826DRAFT_143458 [Russula brevipes]
MSSHNHAREAVQTDTSSEGFGMEERLARRQVFDGPRGLRKATIDDLSDDVVLEIFGFYLDDKNLRDKWHTLVQVCQRWRGIVFASPRRLDLRLLCGGNRSVRAMLDIWPALPIQIEHHHDWDWNRAAEIRLDNMIAALEHPDRVRHMNLFCIPKTWDVLAAAMQVPFPELTYLRLWSHGISLSVLPGGSTPRLRTLRLDCVPFLAVRNLLLSAGDLVNLTLCLILASRSGHVSPESMVGCLSPLKRLELLELRVGPDTMPLPDQPGPPPQARAVLPALTTFSFQGVSDYLEDFVARIDTPVLSRLYLSLELDYHVLSIPHLGQFVGRARRLKPSKAARVSFHSSSPDSISRHVVRH